jgi:hypothetical protein
MAAALAASAAEAATSPPSNWQGAIDSYLQEHLRDPDSMRAKVLRGPREGTFDWRGSHYTGWVVCYSVNARNGYGGYTGPTPFVFVVNDDGVLISADASAVERYDRVDIDAECGKPADPIAPSSNADRRNPKVPT